MRVPVAMIPGRRAALSGLLALVVAGAGVGIPGCGNEAVPTGAYDDPSEIPVPLDFTALPSPQGVDLLWVVDGSEFRIIDGWFIERAILGEGQTEPGFVRITPELLLASPYLDRAVEDGVTYCYRIRAVSAAGVVSSPREPECLRVDFSPPAPPVNVRATAEAGFIRVAWDPSPDDDVLDYRLFRLPPFPSFTYVERPSSFLEFEDASAEPLIEYRYWVRSVDGFGNEGTDSNVARATLPFP